MSSMSAYLARHFHARILVSQQCWHGSVLPEQLRDAMPGILLWLLTARDKHRDPGKILVHLPLYSKEPGLPAPTWCLSSCPTKWDFLLWDQPEHWLGHGPTHPSPTRMDIIFQQHILPVLSTYRIQHVYWSNLGHLEDFVIIWHATWPRSSYLGC